ncbi:MAG: hypothetical protein D6739_10095 [Nitrospirae bacterium]|nr:MAG: hypothetical protein D6739_10095 [Nitrospirota bacterium]
MHWVDTIVLPLLFSVFLVALAYLGWKDLRGERPLRPEEREARARGEGAASTEGPGEAGRPPEGRG